MSEIFNLDDMINKPETKNIEEVKGFYVECPSDSEPESEDDKDGYWVPVKYTVFDYIYMEANTPEEALEDVKHYLEVDFEEHEGYIASPVYYKEGITRNSDRVHEYMRKKAEEGGFKFV